VLRIEKGAAEAASRRLAKFTHHGQHVDQEIADQYRNLALWFALGSAGSGDHHVSLRDG